MKIGNFFQSIDFNMLFWVNMFPEITWGNNRLDERIGQETCDFYIFCIGKNDYRFTKNRTNMCNIRVMNADKDIRFEFFCNLSIFQSILIMPNALLSIPV